jgi:hypothetical protein
LSGGVIEKQVGNMKNEMNARTVEFYRAVLQAVHESGIPFLIGGGFALAHYTTIERYTKDLDLFVRPQDCQSLLGLFEGAGYRTELRFRHWLAKIRRGDEYVDVIFCSGNGVAPVTTEWFEHGTAAEIFNLPVLLCAPEDMIWSKSFVMERDRYDGADIAHLFRACGPDLDWQRLLNNFGPHWRVLLNHLILFEFIYPGEPGPVPAGVVRDLLRKWERQRAGPRPATRVCQGTLLSTTQYVVDIEEWNYEDARLIPRGTMTRQEVQDWSRAVLDKR